MKKYRVKYISGDATINYNHEKDEIRDIDNQLLNQLKDTKELIDKYHSQWDSLKKINHEYEYIYTSSNPHKNISKIVPVSRSYFKLIEILQEYNILQTSEHCNVACIAEAPGGFIQSVLHVSKQMCVD